MLYNQHETSLFFIYTPLHALIAASIIERKDLKNIFIVAFSDGGPKTLQYCNRLFSQQAKIVNIDLHRDMKSFYSFFKIFAIKRKLKHHKVKFYTGSIKSIYSRLFIGSKNNNVEINTFDDGYGNLVLDGYFSQDDSIGKKALLAVLGVASNYFSVLKKISTHYSLYELPNVYDRYCKLKTVVPIQASAGSMADLNLPSDIKQLKVLLTQPYSERKLLRIEEEMALYISVVDLFSIDFYLPHPAENKKKIMTAKAALLETDLIAEEVILSIAKHTNVEVYAFGSTALLNLMNVKNVKCIWMTAGCIGAPAPTIGLIKNIDVSGL